MQRRPAIVNRTKLIPNCWCLIGWLTASLMTVDAVAQSMTRPLGLQSGDEYRIAFVTDGSRDALSTNIADYNAFVTAEALTTGSVVRGLAVDWFAIASTADVDALENTGTDPSPPGNTGVPIYLVDGQTRIANDYDNLWDGDSFGQQILLAPLKMTQYGVSPVGSTGNNVWTGTDYYGVAGGIGGPLGADPTPSVGVSASANGRWINNSFSASASEARSLYAISSVMIAVPEPQSLALVLYAVLLVTRVRVRKERQITIQGPQAR